MGAYYAHGFGSYHMTTNGVTTATNYGFTTYGADDYGAVMSLAFRFKLAKETYLVMDARYIYGFQDISPTTPVATTLKELQALVGIQLGIK